MFSSFLRGLGHFPRGEEGTSAVEYAVTGAIFVAGVCIVVMLAQENSASSFKTEYVTFKVGSDGTISKGSGQGRLARSAYTPNGGGDQSDSGLLNIGGGNDGDVKKKEPSSEGGVAKDPGNVSRTRFVESGLGAEDARQAILALIKNSPNTFATSRRAVQTAQIIRENDVVRIDAFSCYLKSKEFVYRPDNNADQSSGIHGVFYRNEKGKWTATVTQSGR